MFAEIAAAVSLGLYVYQVDDPDDPGSLRLLYANPASVSATGVAVDEIIGRPLRTAFPGLMETALPGIYLEIALGGPARELGEIERDDQRLAPHVSSVQAFPLPDQSVGISFANSTPLRVAEQQALHTLESMSDAFFMLDSGWRFTYLNPQTEAILERRREDLIGKNMWEEFPEGLGSRFDDAYHRAVREQVPVRVEELYDCLGRMLEVRAYPVTGGLAVYFRDVTEERRRDARLRQTQRLEAIGRVTAGVAHDFNNLLTAIRGFANLGQAAPADDKSVRYFAEIDSAAQKAADLTRQLLAFGRRQDLSPTVNDLNDVVAGLSSLLRQLMPSGIELHVARSSQPVPVFVDRSQLEQVLLNLVVNSRDAIETTGAITVTTTVNNPPGVIHDSHSPSGWLQVTDTGAGIPDDVRPHIFEPFFSTKPPETGTGLGLSTIYGIVSQSGGSIFVDSTLGLGTTMTVALPALEPSSPTAHSIRRPG